MEEKCREKAESLVVASLDGLARRTLKGDWRDSLTVCEDMGEGR